MNPTSAAVKDVAASKVRRGGYRFEHPKLKDVIHDMYVRAGEPGGGDPLPAPFDLELVDGDRLRSADLATSGRPLLLAFGSRTCPVTESSMAGLIDLYERYGKSIRFVMVQVREAHPGASIPQPRTMEQKRTHAMDLRAQSRLPFEVAVDDLEGGLHLTLGSRPNSLFVVSSQGTILLSAQWANETGAIGQGLSAIVSGVRPRRQRITRTMPAMMKAIGHIGGVLGAAGTGATADMWKIAPPMVVMAMLADRFQFLPKNRRGIAAMATVALVAGIAFAALARLI